MDVYELTLLLNIDNDVKAYKEHVASVGGTITEEIVWKNKPLAYPIKKQTNATYYIWKLEIAKDRVNELKKKLNFDEQLLRYLLLKVDAK
ncbi:30S ribosomal protein S6 [Candidatus Roizmanbacteria bacterium]|nr:30S ribosomal protein S6 [Candidatus Roizmanbacteria bacterium]